MLAVIAQTEMDPASVDAQQLEDASKMHAVVLFEGRDDAQGFAGGVVDNLPGAAVSVLEVLTEA